MGEAGGGIQNASKRHFVAVRWMEGWMDEWIDGHNSQRTARFSAIRRQSIACEIASVLAGSLWS